MGRTEPGTEQAASYLPEEQINKSGMMDRSLRQEDCKFNASQDNLDHVSINQTERWVWMWLRYHTCLAWKGSRINPRYPTKGKEPELTWGGESLSLVGRNTPLLAERVPPPPLSTTSTLPHSLWTEWPTLTASLASHRQILSTFRDTRVSQ